MILPNRGAGDTSQLCGVMRNTKRLKLDDAVPLAVSHRDGEDSLWDRKPHLVHFSSDINVWRRNAAGEWEETPEKRRFAMVPLHMKSNYGGITENRRVRAKEAVTLCDAIDAIRATADPSIIMIGDTNILNNSEPAIETFISRGFRDLNNNDARHIGARNMASLRSTRRSSPTTATSSATRGNMSCDHPT